MLHHSAKAGVTSLKKLLPSMAASKLALPPPTHLRLYSLLNRSIMVEKVCVMAARGSGGNDTGIEDVRDSDSGLLSPSLHALLPPAPSESPHKPTYDMARFVPGISIPGTADARPGETPPHTHSTSSLLHPLLPLVSPPPDLRDSAVVGEAEQCIGHADRGLGTDAQFEALQGGRRATSAPICPSVNTPPDCRQYGIPPIPRPIYTTRHVRLSLLQPASVFQ